MDGGGFVILTWDGGGNVPPALALAERLAERGHRVRVMAPASLGPAVASTGVTHIPYRTAPSVPPGVRHEDAWPTVFEILNGPTTIDDIRAEVDRDRPDVLIVDSLMGAGLAVGEAAGIPTAILVHTLYQGFRTWGPLVADVKATRSAVGLRPIEPDRFGPDVLDRAACVLAAVTPGLDEPPETVPANTTYVGPILRQRRADDASANGHDVGIAADRPTVLVSFGSTIQRQDEALPPVLEAIAGLPVAALLALGGVIETSTVSAPPNVVVHDRLAFDRILPRIAAVVCHGGLSTIQETLAAGVPLVVIPQGRDQTDNAARVAATGAGLALPRDADPAVIGAAIRRVLDEPAFRAAAGRFAATIAELGSGAVATDLVEGLLDRRIGTTPDRAPLVHVRAG